jgi:site-specific recombinase XerD
VRQFFDFLCGEGVCTRNPVRRSGLADRRRSLIPVYVNLPWIPDDAEWSRIIDVVLSRSLRDRSMFALSYDTGLRKEELCGLQLGDFDHANRTVLVRAEITKSRRARVVPYGQATNALLARYFETLPFCVLNNESIFRSESRRNAGAPITMHTWTKVIESVAFEAQVPEFHPHTLRHLCLTDLARSGWDLLQIRDFAGHKSVKTTEQYIRLSGRDLVEQYRKTITGLHSRRVAMLSMVFGAMPL